MPLDDNTLLSRLEDVERRIQQAVQRAGRTRSDITLVAVTKKFSADTIVNAHQAGLRDFGENYVQEFAEKHSQVGSLSGAKFHLIGHLQSNKIRLAAEVFQVIESIDSVKLLQRMDAIAAERGAPLEVMLEVKLSKEESKSGSAASDLPKLAAAAKASKYLQVCGLMTVPPWSENPEDSRPYFKELADLGRQFGFSKLSMGMSGDFEVAIEEGATTIRVGTALFGPRPKSPAIQNP